MADGSLAVASSPSLFDTWHPVAHCRHMADFHCPLSGAECGSDLPTAARATKAPATFERWMIALDSLCLGMYGMSIYDLPDMLFRDAYDEGRTPEEFMGENLPSLEELRQMVLS